MLLSYPQGEIRPESSLLKVSLRTMQRVATSIPEVCFPLQKWKKKKRKQLVVTPFVECSDSQFKFKKIVY